MLIRSLQGNKRVMGWPVRVLAEARLLTVPEPTSVHLDVAAEVGGLDGWIG